MALEPLEPKNLGLQQSQRRGAIDAPQNYPGTPPLKTIAPPPQARNEQPISPGANVEALAQYGQALERLHAGRKNGQSVAEYAGIPSFDEWASNYLAQMSGQQKVFASSERGNSNLITLKV